MVRASFTYALVLIFEEKAKDFLRGVEGHIAFILFTGFYRTGKSWFINRFLVNQNDAFGV